MYDSAVAENPATIKGTYFVYQANHNHFNTQWQQSDAVGCIGVDNTSLFNDFGVMNSTIYGENSYGSVSQTKIGLSSFLAFFRGNVGVFANSEFNQNFNPRYKLPNSVTAITKIKRGFINSPNQNISKKLNDLRLPQNSNFCSASGGVICSVSNPNLPEVVSKKIQLNRYRDSGTDILNHDLNFTAASVSWTSPAPNRFLQIDSSSGEIIDATEYQTFDFRISRRRNDNPSLPFQTNQLNTLATTNFLIQFVADDGTISKPLNLNKYLVLDGPVGTQDTTGIDPRKGEYHPILQTIRIPLTDIQSVNLTQIRGGRLVFTATSKGAIFLSNFRFSR